jgi:glycerol-3-phosphate dehydrogenase (NAD(P)+)
MKKPIGVIGAGSFGTAISGLLAKNNDVLLFSRRAEAVEQINKKHVSYGSILPNNVIATDNLQEIAEKCDVIYPIIPSSAFRRTMRSLSPFLHPYHILIHGTKGFDTGDITDEMLANKTLSRSDIHTMSEVILQETVCVRVGCLSGPNLASEIIAGQPTAAVVASHFKEVFQIGKETLDSKQFHIFASDDLLGAELSGALKNIIAIGSGILGGLGMGKNLQAMLITRGLTEMVYFGQAIGATNEAFFGTAGIGDLVATATSTSSRNYSFGTKIAQGMTLAQINETMPETAEGIRTLRIAKQLARHYKIRVPITEMLYKIVFEEFEVKKALEFLMTYPYDKDVDFMQVR